MTKVKHLHATTGRDLIKNTRELPNPSTEVSDSVILINKMDQKISYFTSDYFGNFQEHLGNKVEN